MSSRALRPVLALSLLTGLNFLNYIDRYILFGVQPLIKQEFHPSDTALGALTTVFFIFYMCSAPGVGFLADRKSRKLIIIGGALGTTYGWRAPFYVCAVPGFLVGLAFYFSGKEPERGEKEVSFSTFER